ncbi:MAG: hypothetical protein ACETWB_03375 [Anaerolineae bacterium]
MATVRDIAIVILAAESIVIGVLLIFLVIQVQSLIKLLREEVKPIFDSANETVSTVRGTTTFISDTVVSPLVRIISYVSAVRKAIQVLTGRRSKK